MPFFTSTGDAGPASDERFDGLSPAGPAEDEQGGMPLATPPMTDGHGASEDAGSQVLLTYPDIT